MGSTNQMPPKMIKTSPIKSYPLSSNRVVKELGLNSKHFNISHRLVFILTHFVSFFLHGICRPDNVKEPTEKLMSPFLVEDHRSTKGGDQSLSLSPFLVQDHDIKLEDMKKLMEIFIQSDFRPIGQISESGQKKPQYNYPTKFPHQTLR